MMPWRLGILALTLSFLSATVYFQHKHNRELSRELTAAHQALDSADEQLNANRIAQQHAAELDRKYTEQLANAESEINRLRSDVVSGNKRLRIKAQCVPDNTASRSVGDAASPRLTDSAQSNYWILRNRIERAEQQINYLRGYIMFNMESPHSNK